VGGGYIENECRLSDIALNWMLAAASIVPEGIKHDASVLKLWPDPRGPQHDEQAHSVFKKGARVLPQGQDQLSRATMHKSVYRRFEAGEVVLFDKMGRYRPQNLAVHIDFEQYFDGTTNPQPSPNPECVADDIEAKWAHGSISSTIDISSVKVAGERRSRAMAERSPRELDAVKRALKNWAYNHEQADEPVLVVRDRVFSPKTFYSAVLENSEYADFFLCYLFARAEKEGVEAHKLIPD
jgi:hypothetical protein